MDKNFLNVRETRVKLNLLNEMLYKTKELKDRLILIEKIKKIQNCCNHEILINLQDEYNLNDIYYCYCLKCHKFIGDTTNKNIINIENLKNDTYLNNNQKILIALDLFYDIRKEYPNADYKEITDLMNSKIKNIKNIKKLTK